MKKLRKKLLALLLVVTMLVGLVPTATFAETAQNTAPPSEQTVTNHEGEESGTQPPEENLPAPIADGNAAITSMVLKNFGSDGSDYDLLSAEEPVKWDVFTPATLEITVSLTAGTDNHLDLTLPNGMKFVNANIGDVIGIASSSYTRSDEAIYGKYQPYGGTLTVNFDSGATEATFSVSIQPEVAFFPIECAKTGFEVEDAIQVSLNDGTATTVDVKQVTSSAASNPFLGDTKNKTPVTVAGGSVNVEGNAYVGWIGGSATNHRLVAEEVLTFSVPNGVTMMSENWTLSQGETDPDKAGYTLWTATAAGIYSSSGPVIDYKVTVPENATVGTTYTITLKSMDVTTYGQDALYHVDNNMSWLTISVVDPDATNLTVTPYNATNVYNFTKQGNDSGTFSDYNTLFASVRIQNKGYGAIDDALIYEAEFDTEKQFITAVGIPCGWSSSVETYLPTKITVIDENGRSYEISGADAMRAVAFNACTNQGFILRAEKISGYDTSKAIKSVQVELPGLPAGYESTDYAPFFEGLKSNPHTAYVGAWGRVRVGVADGSTAVNKYRIYPKDGAAPDYTTATSTIKDTGTFCGLSTSFLTTITVDGEKESVAKGTEIVHIKQQIYSNGSRSDGHLMETMLVHPVFYILEPAGMTLANVNFSERESGQVLFYHREVAKTLENGDVLYQYTLNDATLGFWDSDWSDGILNVDFDYLVDPVVETKTYDVHDLIFFGSELEGMTEANNTYTSIEDKYGVNDGEKLVAVPSGAATQFTVQTSSSFNVGASIQIDGEDEWYSYNPANPTSTTAVFTEGATANVKITVQNNSGENANGVEVYIPVPKTGAEETLGDGFLDDVGFDMYVDGVADLSNAAGWSVTYGQVTGVSYDDNGVVKEITCSDWSDSYDNNTNMIKLSLPEETTFANGDMVTVILKFKATENTSQVDEMNIFKSWFTYDTSTATIVDTSDNYNFGTLLQNGVVEGTVYLDVNRNGKQDDGENGLANVAVKAVDSENRAYETRTDENGYYDFRSLPGDQALTITIINPVNTSNPYRFSQYVASGADTVGTDVTADSSHSQATATIESLSEHDGTATINAGLVEPATVNFTVDPAQGSVTPQTLKVFVGDTIGDVLTEAPAVTPNEDWEFSGTWLKDGKAIEGDLLDQEVTGDATYTAQLTEKPVEKYQVTVNGSYAENGQSGAGEYEAGATVTINAGSREGYTFAGWTTNDDVTITNASETTASFTMPEKAVTVTANWEEVLPEMVTVTFDKNDGIGTTEPATVEKGESVGDEMPADPTRDGYTFAGWNTAADGSGTAFTADTDVTGNITVYAQWKKIESITVTPADIIIYKGGEDGYDGTVNADGEIVGSTSLPEPGFRVTLPESLKGTAITDLLFQEKGGTKTWHFESYDGQSDDVYKLVPADGQEVTRVQFTKADGTTIVSDEFEVGREVNTSFTMSLYKGDVGSIVVNVDDQTYNVDSTPTAKLTVRGTTDRAEYADLNGTIAQGKAGLAAAEDTTYTINDSDVLAEADSVALLFDDIINSSGNDRVEQLQDRADEELGDADGTRQYDIKYLDLVDRGNGNAWVKASEEVTVYWPLPEGTDEDTDFTLLHFKDLHRDMASGEIEDEIAASEVEEVGYTIEDNHVVFKIGSGGFSPFALVWDENDKPSWPDWPPVGPGDDDDDDNEPPILNTQDHFSYVVGYAEDYRTGQPTDNEDLWPVKPQNNITRAEVASIFYRLLKEDVRDENTTDVSNFSDVKSSDWYGTTVATLADMGIVKGYEDGTFRPNAPITRAEFAAIATRFFDETGATYEPGTFTDVTGSEWFAGAIMDAVNLGLIGGYEDATVRPNNNITRAEACAIVNRTLGRVPDADHLLPEDVMKTWPDNPESAWFYADMQEATNGHEYEWITEDDNKVENWTDLLDKDWNDR